MRWRPVIWVGSNSCPFQTSTNMADEVTCADATRRKDIVSQMYDTWMQDSMRCAINYCASVCTSKLLLRLGNLLGEIGRCSVRPVPFFPCSFGRDDGASRGGNSRILIASRRRKQNEEETMSIACEPHNPANSRSWMKLKYPGFLVGRGKKMCHRLPTLLPFGIQSGLLTWNEGRAKKKWHEGRYSYQNKTTLWCQLKMGMKNGRWSMYFRRKPSNLQHTSPF